ncbi:hypothetical protein OSCI_3460011 [Kamptonema sp. PCC 6506]|uniref:hypothetical protein n=1 Tax=Kamptonema formosum TaxID=331992 RepID=UPI0001DACB2F|nr:hypothetical protein [Kamptonema formosum]CBN57489.1 hypothetical protein OSCI_3460011 [Kamptonema sp. PCC 6506]
MTEKQRTVNGQQLMLFLFPGTYKLGLTLIDLDRLLFYQICDALPKYFRKKPGFWAHECKSDRLNLSRDFMSKSLTLGLT